MFVVINNMKQLNDFLKETNVKPENIAELLSDKHILVAPDVAKAILQAA